MSPQGSHKPGHPRRASSPGVLEVEGDENAHDSERQQRGEDKLLEKIRREEASLTEDSPDVEVDDGKLVRVPGQCRKRTHRRLSPPVAFSLKTVDRRA